MKSLRAHLFVLFVQLALIPMALCTAWSGITSWTKGGDAMGFGWTNQGTVTFPSLFAQTGELQWTRLRLLRQQAADQAPLEIDADELFAVVEGGHVAVTFGAAAQVIDPARIVGAAADASATQRWTFFTDDTRLFFLAYRVEGTKTFLLFKEMTNAYVAKLHFISGAEVTAYAGLKPFAASWKNMNGEVVIPPMPDEALQAISDNPAAPAIQLKARIKVANYNGLMSSATMTSNRGDSEFAAYHTYMPVADNAGKRLGYIAITAPADAVLIGPRYTLYGLLALFAVLSVIAIVVIHRVASRLARPITGISGGIYTLIQTIPAVRSIQSSDPSRPIASGLPRELVMLELAFNKLKHLVSVWTAAEAELTSSRKQLVHSAKMSALGEMAGGIAHEINNPLSVIDVRARQLQRLLKAEPPKIDMAIDFGNIIEKTAERIATIVRGLKTFSRSGEEDPPEVCPLKSVIDDTLILCSERFAKQGVDFKVEGVTEELEITARAVQISQVLLNLLNNSFDAIEGTEHPWILLQVRDGPGGIEISVTDSGPGIAPAIADKIMQPFFTTKGVGKGTGLGLSVSKGIIEDHQGTLTVDTACANTRFVIVLPKPAAAAAA